MEKALRRRRIEKPKKRRKITRKEAQDAVFIENRRRKIEQKGMYPLNAPGMPIPGPNFVRHAQDLGDEDTELYKELVPDESKKSGKKSVDRAKIGDQLHDLYLRALRTPGFTLPIEMRGGLMKEVTFVPGHIWGQHIHQYKASTANQDIEVPSVDGPHRAEVMVVGKMPGKEEEQEFRNLIGPSGEVLVRLLKLLRVKGTPSWYLTNLLKFRPPDGGSTIKASWRKDCMPLLHEELRIVRPKYILCLGTDASNAVLGPKHGVGYMEGRVEELTYPIGIRGNEVQTHTSLVMTVLHPAMVAREQAMERQLERGLSRFNMLKNGIRFDKEEKGIRHEVVSDLDELKEFLFEMEHDPEKHDRIIAMDAEWHGEHAVNDNAYLRTIQIAWKPKHALCVKLRSQGGKIAFRDGDGKPAIKRAIKMLRDYIKGKKGVYKKKRIVGHFFNSDLEYLIAAGLDIQDEFKVPLYDLDLDEASPALRKFYQKKGYKDTVPAWVRTRYEGGADTGMMAHAIEETGGYGLEGLLMRYTTCPRYDTWLHEWRAEYCKENDLKAGALEGYGECPDHILCPTPQECEEHGVLNYAAYDADGTLRLFYELSELLDCDYDGNCCREPFWEAMIATPAVLEIHQNGICVDRDRADFLTEAFLKARLAQEKKVKKWARWKDFNVRSVQHVKEYLFGEDLNGKVTKDGSIVRIRPDKGRSLYLDPLITTSKPPKFWREVQELGKEKEYSPSTNKMVLAILAQENEEFSDQITWIRDYRFLDQVLKTVLRPPVEDDEGNWVYEQAEGGTENLIYEAGLVSQICDDGKVRTHIYQTKETGRWASARPNLMNFSKQRDPDYKRLLGAKKNEKGWWVGGNYKYPLRSLLTASPGHLLIEADYVGAELYGMAIMSGDPTMIDHATRNQLPEDDPNFYDIHSNVAVLAFNLPCKPTKSGMKDIGKEHLRVIAKSVIFGIAYGRGAKAIALAAKEQGVYVTVDEAQQVIDTIFAMYPGLIPFFDECKKRATEDKWLCHCFGRFRRFPYAADYKLEGEFERQAMNFPIQGMIASAVSRAIAYLKDYKDQGDDPNLFRILLQIHDALLVEVPYEHVEFVAQEVLPWAMREMVPIYPSRLDGTPTGDGPYFLGIEADAMRHWGEKLTEEEGLACGLAQKSWHGDGIAVGYWK